MDKVGEPRQRSPAISSYHGRKSGQHGSVVQREAPGWLVSAVWRAGGCDPQSKIWIPGWNILQKFQRKFPGRIDLRVPVAPLLMGAPTTRVVLQHGDPRIRQG